PLASDTLSAGVVVVVADNRHLSLRRWLASSVTHSGDAAAPERRLRHCPCAAYRRRTLRPFFEAAHKPSLLWPRQLHRGSESGSGNIRFQAVVTSCRGCPETPPRISSILQGYGCVDWISHRHVALQTKSAPRRKTKILIKENVD